jgi:DNA polymerase III subunit delta
MVARKGHEVEAFLRRPDPAWPVILVYGPNGGLVSERVERIVAACVGDPSDAFQAIRLDGDDIAGDPLRLADEANTIGLFGGKRLIRVRAGSRNLTPCVQPLLQAPPSDAVVVIEAGDLAARHPLRVAVEASRSAVALPCFADEARDIAQVIDEVMQAEGLTIARAARDILLDHVGTDRMLARREIEKVALYCSGRGTVTAADVEAVMSDESGVAVDQVIDAAFLGDMDALDRGLTRLAQEGEDPGMVAGAALRHAILLHRSRIALDGGADIEGVERSARIFFKRKAAFQKQLNRWSTAALEGVLATLREAQTACRRQGHLARPVLSRAFIVVALRVRGRA